MQGKDGAAALRAGNREVVRSRRSQAASRSQRSEPNLSSRRQLTMAGAATAIVSLLAGCAGERPPLWDTPQDSGSLLSLPNTTVTESRTVIQATPGMTYREIPTQPQTVIVYPSGSAADPRGAYGRPNGYFYPEHDLRCSDAQRTCTRYSSKRNAYRLDAEATRLYYGPQGVRIPSAPYQQPQSQRRYVSPMLTSPQAPPVPVPTR